MHGNKPGGALLHNYPFNVSFTINTDGIPVFKSSKMALWPICLMIHELPKRRKLRENMVLAGLWFGPTKPLMTTFTKPLQKCLTDLEYGFDV